MNLRHFNRISLTTVRKCMTSQSESRTIHICNNNRVAKGKSLLFRQAISKDTSANITVEARCISPGCAKQIRSLSFTTDKKSSKDNENPLQRPKAETTIDEEEINNFNRLSGLWWNEGGEFEALHALNELRIPLIRDALVSSKTLDQYDAAKPLEGLWILDVGSGGGILSEALARIGASVVGVEASEESIKIAQAHLVHDPTIREKVRYVNCTVEEIAETQAGKFDAVVASEVVEHVNNANLFVNSACKLVRPGGSIFFTTLNKTRLAYLLGIIVAERIMRIVPAGTHDWEKFVPPADLQRMLEKNNFSTRLVHGMWYNPFSKRWCWGKDTSVSYALHAIKPPATDEQTWDVPTSQDSNMLLKKDGK